MKLFRTCQLVILTLGLWSLQAIAQSPPSVIISSGSGDAGQVAPVNISVTYTADPAVVAFQVEIEFDAANLTPDLTFCDPGPTPVVLDLVSCSQPSAGLIRIIVENAIVSAVANQLTIPIPFDISLAEIADYPLSIVFEKYVNSGAVEIPTGGSTSGLITINPPPQPDYSSIPTPATGVAFSVIQNNPDPTQNILISNAGEATSTLTGTCTETADPDSVFTISGDTSFSVLQGAAADIVTVTCDSAGSIALHTGEMTCRHDGDGTTEASPAVYALSCNITAGPQAAYSDVVSPDPLNLVAVEEGDANPTGTITVTNTGDATTTLAGTCAYSGDPQITLANGAFSLAQNASNVTTLTCNASAEGIFSGSVSCTHDAGNVPSPVVHDVTCDVGPPGPAVYASTPAPGATIDMTPPGNDAVVGDVVATKPLQITNSAAESNDRSLALLDCAFTGSSAITATAPSTPLAPFASTTVTFSCNTAEPGAFTGTYSCNYDDDGDGQGDGPATYTVNCGVRAPESDVTVNPVSGTRLTIVVPIGGSGQASVSFGETIDEGADGVLELCSLDDDTYHSIISSTDYPQDIPSGGSLQVVVEGTNPGDPTLEASATLTCFYSDSDSERTQVSWPVDIVVQAEAIPTLSAMAMIVMILTLMGLGGFVIRRKVNS